MHLLLKQMHLPALLVALALVLTSCGGDEQQAEPQTADRTAAAERADRPAESRPSQPRPATARRERNGDGGSSAAEAERAAGETPTPAPAQDGTRKRPKQDAPKRKGKLTPAQQVAALSPAERRRLHKDLFEQGKRICYAYGPEELAKSVNLPNRDPETVARLYARLYESATPSLALPYQQGCLVGFKRFARNPPKN